MGCSTVLTSSPTRQTSPLSSYSQHDSLRSVVLSPEEVRQGLEGLPHLPAPGWSDPQVRPQHLPPVLPRALGRHRLHQEPLKRSLPLVDPRCLPAPPPRYPPPPPPPLLSALTHTSVLTARAP